MNNSIDTNNDREVAEFIISSNDLFYYNQSFYTYESNVWKPIGLFRIKQQILEILQDKYKQSRVNNILDIIQLNCRKEAEEINLNKKYNALNVKNGVYYLNENKLKPHNEETKQMFSTNLFDIDYKVNAKCERWEQFLYEVFQPDKDKYDKILLLQEYLGYCLTQDVAFQKALLLLGTGSNGKSKVIEVMENILGEENYSNLELNQLSNKNYIVELQNKLANFCSEIDHKNKFSSSVFKRIVTGETLTGDAKFKHPIQFRPYCKLIFAANDLPKTSDTTKGYFRRLLIIKFNRSFDGKQKDTNLLSKLLNESDGIFNWLLEGLNRLYENNEFTVPESSYEEIERYLEASNSVVSFIADKCVIINEKDIFETYDNLYTEYKIFCSDSNLRPFSKVNFRAEIQKQYPGKIIFDRRGDRGNHFQNIKCESNRI